MKLAAVYTRVSTPEQERSGTSLESQSRACHEYAERAGYSVVLEASDTYTGRTLSRAGLTRIMDGARSGEFEVVVCYAIDRTSRDLADLLMLDRELTRCGVTLEFVQDRRDRSPAGTLFFQMRGVFAEYERSQIIERTRRGKEARARRGEIFNMAYVPYGYAYDRAARTFRVREDQAEVVRVIYHLLAEEGYNLSAVARHLNETAVPTARGARYWRPETVRVMVVSEVYVGRWAWNKRAVVPARRTREGTGVLRPSAGAEGNSKSKQYRPRSEWIYVDVPPIVERDTWARAQERLRRNRELSRRNRKRDYLLAGLVRCAVCHSSMHGTHNGFLAYYKCQAPKYIPHRERCRCSAQNVRTDTLDGVVWGEVVSRITDPFMLDHVPAAEEPEAGRRSHELARLEGAAQKLSQERERLLDVYVSGDIERDLFTSRMEALRRRESVVEREREAHTVREEAQREQEHKAADILAMLGPVLEANPEWIEDPSARRDLVLTLDVRVVVEAGGEWATIRDWPWPPARVPIPRTRRRARERSERGD